ncbi:MAG: gamma-glutamylcyclotransferase family protein [Clostridiaceae bacterium]
MEKIIYAAYGSNMNLQQMKQRCPRAKVIGKGQLKNYRLTFRGVKYGVANIEEKHGYNVPIVLWEITNQCEKALDRYEGYPDLYIKKEIKVMMEDGTEVTAMAYVMTNIYGKLPAKPLERYINVIWEGYKDNGIPVNTLRTAISESHKEIDYLESENKKNKFSKSYQN